MPSAADFRFIRDARFEIARDPGDPDREFQFPIGPAVEINQESVLMFRYRANLQSPRAVIQVLFGSNANVGDNQLRYSVRDGDHGTIHEIINANVLEQSDNNRVRFNMEEGSGNIRIQDVVLLLRVNI